MRIFILHINIVLGCINTYPRYSIGVCEDLDMYLNLFGEASINPLTKDWETQRDIFEVTSQPFPSKCFLNV